MKKRKDQSKINTTENNNSTKNQNNLYRKKRLRIALMRTSLLALLLIFSTYAWFTSQKDITLSNLKGTIEVVENMEISLDAKNWYQQIDFTNAEVLFENAQISRDYALEENGVNRKTTALAIVPSQLLPVSGMGEKGGTLMPLYTGEATSTTLSGIAACEEETLNALAQDIAKDNGYFAFDIYIKNTSRDDENDVLQLNVNSIAKVLTDSIEKTVIDENGNSVKRTYVGNSDSGLQNTIRVGLAMYNGEISSTATQVEILNSTKGATIKDIAIWEPNAYDHVESIVANNNKLINGTSENKIPFENGNIVDTYALNTSAVGKEIENVYNIKSTGLGLQSTFKTDNVKDGDGEIIDYGIYTEDAKPLDLKNIEGNNFEILANRVTRFRVYVWLEGQDIDCINIASLGGGIELDLGLTKDDEIGNGGDNRLLASVDYSVRESASGEVTATITANKELQLPDGWTYGVTESYAIASTDTVKIATNATQNKNVISKVYSGNVEEILKLEDADGNTTVVKIKIGNIISEFTRTIADNPAAHYGKYINYPVDIDGNENTNDWMILYTNGTNVFIIPEAYVPIIPMMGEEKLAELKMKKGYSNLNAYWEDPSIFNYTIDANSKYMISQASKFTKTNPNYQVVGCLLDTEIWTPIFGNNEYAESAIGSPTFEMIVASWNTLYPENKLYCDKVDSNGYYLGLAPDNYFTTYAVGNGSADLVGYPNPLFYRTYDHDDHPGYWLATPIAESTTELRSIFGSSSFYTLDYYSVGGSFRPVVCLKSDVKATLNGDVWELEENT